MAATRAPTVRPPVALGCTLAAAGVGFVVFVAVLAIVFLESGSDDGSQTLDAIGAYPAGSITRVADRGFYIVRLPAGRLIALSDLDAPNRAAARRCRVAPIALEDPILPGLLSRVARSMNPEVAGTTTLLSEACNQALYDISGLHLGGDGPNLDRLAVDLDKTGHVVVRTSRRTCTERSGRDLFLAATCR